MLLRDKSKDVCMLVCTYKTIHSNFDTVGFECLLWRLKITELLFISLKSTQTLNVMEIVKNSKLFSNVVDDLLNLRYF